jgi:DNA-directed RNA polymerase beta subunit
MDDMLLKEQHLGKVTRMSFSKNDEVLEMPNLIEIQKKSFKELIERDIKNVLADISPMTDYSGNLIIELLIILSTKRLSIPLRSARREM